MEVDDLLNTTVTAGVFSNDSVNNTNGSTAEMSTTEVPSTTVDPFADCDTQHIIYTDVSKAVFSLLYLVIFVIGFFGNVLVSLAVIRSRHMYSVTNFFILNLAASDILMCLFSVPFTPLQSFLGRWLFGPFLCMLFPFSQGVSVYISTLTLTIIAIDRFVIIIYPFRARMMIKTCVALIAIIDVLACVFTLPYVFHMTTVPTGPNATTEICIEDWPAAQRLVYGTFTNVTQFVLPFCSIILCYTAIIRKLGARSTARPGVRSAAREEMERARNAKMNRMLISMVVVFGGCWLPLNTINFLADLDLFDRSIFCWEYHNLTFFICHVIAMSSTCYNPFLYGWHNESFQKEFVRMLPLLKGVCGSADGLGGKGGGGGRYLRKRLNGTAVDNDDDHVTVHGLGTTEADSDGGYDANASIITRMTNSIRRASVRRSKVFKKRKAAAADNKAVVEATNGLQLEAVTRPNGPAVTPPISSFTVSYNRVARENELNNGRAKSESYVPPPYPEDSPLVVRGENDVAESPVSNRPGWNRTATVAERSESSKSLLSSDDIVLPRAKMVQMISGPEVSPSSKDNGVTKMVMDVSGVVV